MSRRQEKDRIVSRWNYRLGILALVCALSACSYRSIREDIRCRTGAEQNLTVEAAYPLTGKNWNDYVENDNDGGGTNFRNQNEEACTTLTGGGPMTCIHGGAVKKVLLPGVTSCDGLSARDEYDALHWQCYVDGGQAYMYSLRLADNKGLSHLINPPDGGNPTFKPNRVIVYGATGCPTYQSDFSVWWENDLREVTLNPTTPAITLNNVDVTDTIGTIWTISSSGASNGIILDDDKIGLVTLNGAELQWGDSAVDTCGALRCLVYVDGFTATTKEFVYLEGKYNGDGTTATDAEAAVRIRNGSYIHVNNFLARLFVFGAIVTTGTVENSQFTFVSMHNNNGGMNLSAAGSQNINVYHLRGANNTTGDVASGPNTLQLIHASNNNTGTVNLNADGTLVQMIGLGVDGNLVNTAGSNATIHMATLVNSTSRGLRAAGVLDATYSNILSINHTHGLAFDNVDSSTLSQYSSGGNTQFLIQLVNDSDSNGFYGDFFLGENSCSIAVGCDLNLLADPSCNHGTGSAFAPVSTGSDFSATIIGKTGDSTNATANASGEASFDASLDLTANPNADWINFKNIFLGWGQGGSAAFPDDSLQGFCTAGETCQIWDLRLSNHGLPARNAHGEVLDTYCPASINGNGNDTQDIVLTNERSTNPSTYLVNAFEIWGDWIGDDDGLCENNEACIYQPNIGAFAGEGDYTKQSCAVTKAGFTGVTMYYYPKTHGM